METLEQFSKRTGYQADLHAFCAGLSSAKIRAEIEGNHPKKKVLQQIEEELRIRELWY